MCRLLTVFLFLTASALQMRSQELFGVRGIVSVVGADGVASALSGIEVSLGCLKKPDQVLIAVTDDAGSFVFNNVLPDRCQLKSAAPDVEEQTDTIDLTAISLDIATFSGYPAEPVTERADNGVFPLGVPFVFVHRVMSPPLRQPYGLAWNVQLDRELAQRLMLRLGYDKRHTHHELYLDPVTTQSNSAI